MTSDLAPIVLFVYNRPLHTRQTVEALRQNTLASKSDLFIYSDAPKTETAAGKVQEVRKIIHSLTGFKSVTIIERDKNLGLANSITDGVTTIIEKFGRIIVLEDDLITAPNFLAFMNEALEKYENEPLVFSISGYSHTSSIRIEDSTYFLKLTSSWGWATWSGKWKSFERNPALLEMLLKDKNAEDRFNYHGSYDYSAMARKQLEGKIDSWAIFWYASVLSKDGLTLYPAKSLVQNIGFDGSGVHCGIDKSEKITPFSYELTNHIFEKNEIAITIAEILGRGKRNIFRNFLNKFASIFQRLFVRLKTI